MRAPGFRRLIRLAMLAMLLFAVVPVSGSAAGNAGVAHRCQQGGWHLLIREDATPFLNQGDCVSYGAQGGTLFTQADAPCLNDGWQSRAPEGSDTPFDDQDACVAVIDAGGATHIPDPRTVSLTWDAGSDETVCIAVVSVTGFAPGSYQASVGGFVLPAQLVVGDGGSGRVTSADGGYASEWSSGDTVSATVDGVGSGDTTVACSGA